MLYYGPVNDANLVENWVTRSLFVPCASPKYLEKAGYPENPDELSDHAGVVSGRIRKFWLRTVGSRLFAGSR